MEETQKNISLCRLYRCAFDKKRAEDERFAKIQDKLDLMRKERYEQTGSIEKQISSSADSIYWQLYHKL